MNKNSTTLLIILLFLLFFNVNTESSYNYARIGHIFGSIFGLKSISGEDFNGQKNKNDKHFKYNSYDDIIKYMSSIESEYKDIITLRRTKSKIGLKCGNEECIYAQIILGVNDYKGDRDKYENIPNILILSGTHGDEKIGVAVSIGLIESILREYSKGNIGIMHLLETRRIWVVPMVNPWGYYYKKRNEMEVDVNRDFPSNSGKNCLLSESSRMIYDLYNENSFLFAATLHSGLKSISYGKGEEKYNLKEVGDEEKLVEREREKILELIGKELQFSAGKILEQGKLENYYKTLGNIENVVYSVNGGFEDWSLFGYANEWRNMNYLKCNELIGSEDKANKGGTLTYLIEIDDNKEPPEDTLGMVEDVFEMIDLDKISHQPSHVTRNIRVLLKLIEYSKPEILFLSRPPNILYYGQSFKLNLLVTGCYSFSNLILFLKGRDSTELKLKFVIERNGSGNNSKDGYIDHKVQEDSETYDAIYYQRCSSIFTNNRQLSDSLRVGVTHDFKDINKSSRSSSINKCSDSDLLSKIVNRSFRVKNKCKSHFQYNNYKPITLLVKIPSESVILDSFNRNFEDFVFNVELEFDKELQEMVYDASYRFEKNERDKINYDYGYYWKYFGCKSELDSDNRRICNRVKQKLGGFPIKLNRPQELMQIEFSNCQYEPNGIEEASSKDDRNLLCLLFYELTNYYYTKKPSHDDTDIGNYDDYWRKRPYRDAVSSYLNDIKVGFGDDYMLRKNLDVIRNCNSVSGKNNVCSMMASVYILPSDPRTSSLSVDLREISRISQNYSRNILSDIQDLSQMLPYFGNVTLDLSLRMSSDTTKKGEYYLFTFSQFTKLLGKHLFRYSYLEEMLSRNSKFDDYIAVFSLADSTMSNNQEVKYINMEKVMNILSDDSWYQRRNFAGQHENHIYKKNLNHSPKAITRELCTILDTSFVLVRFGKDSLKTTEYGEGVSIALGKVHLDSYLRFSSIDSKLDNLNEIGTGANIHVDEKDQINTLKVNITNKMKKNIDFDFFKKENIIKKHKDIKETLFEWWRNDSKGYINIRLVFVLILILLVALPLFHCISVVFRKRYTYLPFDLLKRRMEGRLTSDPKTLVIEMHPSESVASFPDSVSASPLASLPSSLSNDASTNYQKTRNSFFEKDKEKRRNKGIGNIISNSWKKRKKYDSPEVQNSPRRTLSPCRSVSLTRIKNNAICDDDCNATEGKGRSLEILNDSYTYYYKSSNNISNRSYSRLQQRVGTTGNYNGSPDHHSHVPSSPSSIFFEYSNAQNKRTDPDLVLRSPDLGHMSPSFGPRNQDLCISPKGPDSDLSS